VNLVDGAHTYIEGNIQGFGGNTDFPIDLLGNITVDANDFLFGGP
jgi:hypothetical protein